jgi:hypothetical protein
MVTAIRLYVENNVLKSNCSYIIVFLSIVKGKLGKISENLILSCGMLKT